MCRSQRELSNEYLLAKFGFDTAENELSKVCPLSAYIFPRSFCPQTRDRQVVSAHTRETSGLRAAFSSRCTPASACSAGPAAWSNSAKSLPSAPRAPRHGFARPSELPSAARRTPGSRVSGRVERFDRRGTEPFEPFEFFQNRDFPEFFLRKFKISENFNLNIF